MWNGEIVSVVLPTYREKNSIRECVLRFLELNIVDELIVVDNNAEFGTRDKIEDLAISILTETTQGYGAALKLGMKQAKGGLIILCEPDGTFYPEDIYKLLEYSKDCDAVFGSRTVQTFIWGDANMGLFLRWGNWAVAKFLEVLFNSSYMSDVGCTFRLMKKNVVNFVLDKNLSNVSSFGLEMQVEIIKAKQFKYVQIPLKYGARVGESTITGEIGKSIKLGLRMIRIILVKRFISR